MLQILDGAAPPTALLACSLPLLVGTLRAIDRRGLAVGRDLALVGWDDAPLAELSRPPIAVVDRDPRGLGAAAATLALRRLGHGGVRDEGPAAGRDPPDAIHPAGLLHGGPAAPRHSAPGEAFNGRYRQWLSCFPSRPDAAPS